MLRFWHRWYRSMTGLALAAMLLATVGPLIAQTERLLDSPHRAMAEGAPDGSSYPAMAHHGHESETDASRVDRQDHGAAPAVSLGHHLQMAACGYCDLFLHIPGVEPPRFSLPTSTPPAHATAFESIEATPRDIQHRLYSSRAPPRVA